MKSPFRSDESKPRSSLQRVFREVARSGETSPPELARLLGLELSTVNAKLRMLVQKGMVQSPGGRERVVMNASFGYVVGIDLGGSHIHYALADFRGETLCESDEKIRPEAGPAKLIRQTHTGIRTLLAGLPRHGRLRAVAIGVPSPVTPKLGVVTWANNLPGWKDVHLKGELEREFRVPIFLENDANMAAIGEHWRGVARGVGNFVFIALGTGIGAGVFIDGKLYVGRTGAAGELYRMNVEWPRWNEDFGDTGHFESYVSGLGIAAEGHKSLSREAGGRPSGLREERDAYFVFEALRQGNARAREVLERIFTLLGVGVANIVAVLDPDLIVFGGGVSKGAPDLMLATVEKVVRRIQPDPPPLKLSALQDRAQTCGAIFSALGLAQDSVVRQLR
ncbi:MAG TPA: ROK family transcriptional regulator [Terriglobia bacterium]|nr:ROK family transcriptional regulator [Terriglobia bacterium]